MVKKSQAFAALRTQVITELQGEIQGELVPNFNSEIVDIRKKYETTRSERGEALADHEKRARITDLKVRQQEFIDECNRDLAARMEKRVKEYGGEIVTITTGEGKEAKSVLEAKFPDGSTARVPKALWIDYNQFDRV
jgi:very-short-patch-repair endonuclease